MIVEEISVEETYKRHLASDILLIDVRTPEEFSEVHAANAVLEPLDSFNPSDLKTKYNLSEEDDIYFICRSGARSYTAGELTLKAGYKKVFNITGGTLAWEDANLPVKK